MIKNSQSAYSKVDQTYHTVMSQKQRLGGNGNGYMGYAQELRGDGR